ncbi:MAG: Na+/H+ antiporter NhaA [Thiolinea sp.]
MSEDNGTSLKEVQQPLERRFEEITKPFNEFIKTQISGAVLLLGVTLLALIMANTSLQPLYVALEKIRIGFFVQDFELSKTLHHWVNDGLMVLFFFLLGLEIKREFIAGELRSFSQSSTVIMAALGGMLFPAGIYILFNLNQETVSGWGIPMATDAAFALGALALLGSRIPAELKVFLVALAIVDDIGAILVIALFYTDALQIEYLWYAAGFLALLLILNRLGIRRALPYFILGTALWYVVLLSGVHATIAGVLAAFAIPARPRVHPHNTARNLQEAADEIAEVDAENPQQHILGSSAKHNVLESVEQQARDTKTLLRSWEYVLERPVSLLIVPLFAFLNAGIVLSAATFQAMQTSALAQGVILGLVVGKPLGIVLLAWLNLKLGWGQLPPGVTLWHLLGVGMLAGIGFTMSIFVAALSFDGSVQLLTEAKASIMLATTIAALAGTSLLLVLDKIRPA